MKKPPFKKKSTKAELDKASKFGFGKFLKKRK